MSEKDRIKRAIMFFLLFFIIIIFSSCLPEREPLPPLNPPHEIAGLKMTKAKTGRPALKELYSLHGLSVGIINGYVAAYSDGENEVTIYYSEAESIYSAGKLIKRMVKKISEGNKYFIGFKEKKMGSFFLYSVTGMGQEHYFFKTDKRVIWIAGDSAVIESTLSEYLQILAKEKMLKK